MTAFGLETEVVDAAARDRAVARFRDAGIALPTFAQLADPTLAPASVAARLARIGADDADAANLFRVHWFNGADRTSRVDLPGHLVAPPELTGVDATIVLAFGDRFPMIGAHKVLAAYACLAPRVVTGQFDPTAHRAIWPSTGNYCRGGVAISRIMGCRGVAVLPEGMSRERFEWLERMGGRPRGHRAHAGVGEQRQGDLRRVRAARTRPDERHPEPVLRVRQPPGHHSSPATRSSVFEALCAAHGDELRLRAFVSASGSAGTLAAGDCLKERFGSLTVAVEALECPTMLRNGFGEHNIQGIGDKHVPLHPQRDEHRRRDGGVRSLHRRARRALQHARGAASSSRRRGVSADVIAALPTPRPLLASATSSQRSRSPRSCGLGPGDRHRHRRDRRRPRCTALSEPRRWPGCRPDGFDERAAAARVRRAPRSDHRRPPARVLDRRSQPHLQPRLLHLGRAAGRLARRLRGPPGQGVLGPPTRPRAEMGRR